MRKVSETAWLTYFKDTPETMIDSLIELDERAILDCMIEESKQNTETDTNSDNIYSDLYLFQIAVDFHFVKEYLSQHNIYEFNGSWSAKESALSPVATTLFNFKKFH